MNIQQCDPIKERPQSQPSIKLFKVEQVFCEETDARKGKFIRSFMYALEEYQTFQDTFLAMEVVSVSKYKKYFLRTIFSQLSKLF